MRHTSYRARDYQFGRTMLSLRNDIRMTQVDMGKVLGVSRHTVLSWEAGEKYPNSENLQRFIALAFEHGAFPGGEEAAAIQKLWEASRQKVLLDRAWLDTLLLRHAPATPHRADNETQTTTERHVFVNLPFQPTSFVGRANELAQLAVILNRSDCRLLTLLGPGGVGKTRLGLELAEHTSNFFRDGVVFVGLAALRTPDQVVLAMGESLGLSFFKQADATASVLDYLRERSILLILDNFEHLLEGVEVVNAVLAHAPRVKVLTTSRERLNLQAEWIFDVEGLSYPTNVTETSAPRSLEALRDYAAITLFVQRALQVQPELTYSEATLSIIVNVCQHVAGLPLAIELAAASLRTSTLAVVERQILSNLTALSTTLRDVPPRHRSLRATFDHSWDLLDEAERALLSRLTIFRGSWDQAAVQTICKDHTERPTGGNHEESNTPSPHLLASLVDKSLVRQINVKTVEPRFVLLEPIREYALEHLTARGEAELVQLAHTSYYMALAEEAEAQLGSLTTEAAMELLNLEHDNLLAALTWARDRNDYVTGFRLGTTLVRFWRWGGFLSEGRRWLEELLALKGDVTDSDDVLTLHLQAVQGAAWLAFDQQDHKRASELFEQSRLLQLSLGKTEEDPKQSMNVALQARSVGDYSRARALLERTVSKHQALDSRQHLNPSRSEPSAIGLSVILLAWCLRDQGDIAGAKAIFEKRAAVYREIGDPRGLATALQGLSCVASDVGDSAGVREYGEESLVIFRAEASALWVVAFTLSWLARGAYQEGDLTRALDLISECVAIVRTQEASGVLAEVLITQGRILQAQGDLAGAQTALTEALHHAWLVGPRLMVAAGLEELANLMVHEGRASIAVQSLSAAATMREEMKTPVPPVDQALLAQTLEAARSTLSTESFGVAWSQGKLPLERVITIVLSNDLTP